MFSIKLMFLKLMFLKLIFKLTSWLSHENWMSTKWLNIAKQLFSDGISQRQKLLSIENKHYILKCYYQMLRFKWLSDESNVNWSYKNCLINKYLKNNC